MSVIQIVLVGAIVYGGAALLNARSLERMAERLPFGGRRDVAVHVADVAGDVSAALGLDRPARLVEGIRTDTPPPPASVDAAPAVRPEPTTVAPPSTLATTPTPSTAPDALRAGAPPATATTTPSTTTPPTTTTTPPPTTMIPPLRAPTADQPL
ncbi:MAG TPA: hypothetical protein VKD67_09725, partial [Acidimicrobiales bacterium]|nr:hypothetical protein [Acidimicrobiales bacterium]